MKKLEFTINKGTAKDGRIYYYLENSDINKRVFLSDLEVKVLKLLKLVD